MLRIFFQYKRRLLGDLCRSALRSLIRYFEIVAESELMAGVIAAIQTFGTKINFHPHLHFLVTVAVDKIIDPLKLTFVADRPPPPHLVYQEVLTAAETTVEYFS